MCNVHLSFAGNSFSWGIDIHHVSSDMATSLSMHQWGLRDAGRKESKEDRAETWLSLFCHFRLGKEDPWDLPLHPSSDCENTHTVLETHMCGGDSVGGKPVRHCLYQYFEPIGYGSNVDIFGSFL